MPRRVDDDCLQELRWLYDRRDLAEARRDLAAWLTKWSGKYSKLTGWVEDNIDETLTFYRLPRQHHKHLKSTNMLERLNEEIRRRTHVVRIFPNGESCLRLVRALAVCPFCGSPITGTILARIEEAERARIAKIEQALTDKFARERAAAERESKSAIETVKRDAAKAAQAQIRAFRANQETTITARVQAARDTAEKKLADAIAAEKGRSSVERIKLTQQLAELKRRLENRTADEIGSGACRRPKDPQYAQRRGRVPQVPGAYPGMEANAGRRPMGNYRVRIYPPSGSSRGMARSNPAEFAQEATPLLRDGY